MTSWEKVEVGWSEKGTKEVERIGMIVD